MDYQWEASFTLNGAKCRKKFAARGWLVRNLPSKGKKPKVQFVLQFTKRKYQDYWRLFDSIEKRVDEILDTMAPDLFFNLGSPSFPVVSDFELKLKNVAQLLAAGKKVPSHGLLHFTYNLVISPTGLRQTLKRDSQIQRSSNARIIRHALQLYRRGLSHEDCFDKFFTLWRSFNAIYNHFSKRKSEPEQISDALQILNSNDITYLITTYSNVQPNSELAIPLSKNSFNLFQYLAGRKLIDLKNRNRSQELRQAISAGQRPAMLEKAVLCLYVVRCNFAHGSNLQITKDKDLFLVSATFLAALLMCLRSKLV